MSLFLGAPDGIIGPLSAAGDRKSSPAQGTIIRADVFKALQSSSEIIAHANRVAANILAQANEEQTKIFESAKQSGEKAGLEQYQTQLFAIHETAQSLDQHFEQEAATLVFDVLRRVIPTLPEGVVTDALVQGLLRQVRGVRKISVHVAPSEHASALERSENWKTLVALALQFEIVSDANMAADECVVNSDFGSVKARLSEQLNAIEAAITAAQTESPQKRVRSLEKVA